MIGRIAVSLAALRANAHALRELVRPARAAFVVKSNAYGHGLVDVALAIEPYAAQLCVYSLEEALALRRGGVTAPVLVMGPVPANALDAAYAAKVSIALWDMHGYLYDVVRVAERRHGAFSVHVKIDTGTARFGIDSREAPDAIEEYLRRPELHVAGIFSHLAAAEELDSPYTLAQLARLEGVCARVEPLLHQRGAHPTRHIAASAAAMLWPQTRLDMARIGIALYGLWPSPQARNAMLASALELQPALTYLSSLAAVREIPAGTPVGYGLSHIASERTRIGVVPLGYADGIPRALSNTGAFVVDGARCPIVGRVCMNVTLLDLAAAPAARAGSAVTLIGTQGEATVSADDWAECAGTINYEIVARLPAEIPRDYEA